MEDRRNAFPGKDDPPEHNILDGPHMRTENDPINVVHKRYWALLAVGVLCVGLFSFYTPASMTAALHCSKDETAFVYMTINGGAIPARTEIELTPLPETAVDVLRSHTTSHMLQTALAPDVGPALVIYPAEDTNYGLYVTENEAYVFAVDKYKARYRVKDEDGTFYRQLCGALDP